MLDDYLERTHLAVTGKSWKVITEHFKDLVPRVSGCLIGVYPAIMCHNKEVK
jgi:hypothetical protein